MKQHILSVLFKLSVASSAILYVACQSDMADVFVQKAGDPVVFNGFICETNEIRTRAEGLDSSYITSDPYNMEFYIQLCCDGYKEMGTYGIPSLFEGRLEPRVDKDTLKWHDLTTPHIFYAWNIPWNTEPEDKYKENDRYNPDDKNQNIEEGLNIKFYDSSEKGGYDDNKNNVIYENFIGAKSVPYSYKEHGKYVDLTFYHLVSKIRIGSFILIEASGAIQENLQADLTFIGMPTEATFYPHPTDDGRPRVDKKEASPDDGVTYFIHNSAAKDSFYICPEVDFSKIDFKVKINNEEYKDYDTYYGTFDDVTFERKSGWAYDQGEDKDSKILHAGEVMTLNIVLIPGKGPGLSIVIDKWNTEDLKSAEYHAYPGLYSKAEVNDILDVFRNQKSYPADETEQEKIDRLFEMYGETDEEGNKYFPLYENVDITEFPNSNIFPIPDGYILDGQGHTITMKTNRGSNGDWLGSQTYFNVGPVRDVWFTDGTNTIYIDKEGYVWIEDKENPGNYKKTEHQLPDLELPYKGYDISCETGIVHKTTYYNNNVVGTGN